MPDEVKMISAVQQSKITRSGTAEDVVEVTFTVDGEGPFSIDVPADSFESETVRPMLDNYVRRIRAVKGLFS